MNRHKGPGRRPKGDTIAREYSQGMTLRELSERHGISKQAVSRILQRRGKSPTVNEWLHRTRRAARERAIRTEPPHDH